MTMMSRSEIESEIRGASDLLTELLRLRPKDEDLLAARIALDKIGRMVSRAWPLPPADRAQINIGLYAVRVLEGGPYGKLPDMLMALDAHLKKA